MKTLKSIGKVILTAIGVAAVGIFFTMGIISLAHWANRFEEIAHMAHTYNLEHKK